MERPTVTDEAPLLASHGFDAVRGRHARTVRGHVAVLAIALAVVVLPNVASFVASLVAE